MEALPQQSSPVMSPSGLCTFPLPWILIFFLESSAWLPNLSSDPGFFPPLALHRMQTPLSEALGIKGIVLCLHFYSPVRFLD